MDSNFYFYSLSAMPQVLAALIAVIGAFLIYKINNLIDRIVGNGRAVLARVDSNEDVYKKLKETSPSRRDRLEDAISRKSVKEIGNEMKFLSDEEKKLGRTELSNPNGLQGVYKIQFLAINNELEQTKKKTKCIFRLTFISIFLSIISLALGLFIDLDCKEKFLCAGVIVVAINILLFLTIIVCLLRIAISSLLSD